MTDKPHLFYNNLPCCMEIRKIIKEEGMENQFVYHDVTDPAVLSKLPPSFKRVPILVVKGIQIPLIGKEVFTWVETQKYINLTANNINTSRNPEFRADPSLGKSNDVNYAAYNDADDDKLNSDLASIKEFDRTISNNLSKRFIDTRINSEAQQHKLQQLLLDRNTDLERIMESHKKF